MRKITFVQYYDACNIDEFVQPTENDMIVTRNKLYDKEN